MKTHVTTIAQLVPLPLLVATAYASWNPDYDSFTCLYAVGWSDASANGDFASGYAEVEAACGSLSDEGKFAYTYGFNRVNPEPQEIHEDGGHSSYNVISGFDVYESEWRFVRSDAQATHESWWADTATAWAQAESNI